MAERVSATRYCVSFSALSSVTGRDRMFRFCSANKYYYYTVFQEHGIKKTNWPIIEIGVTYSAVSAVRGASVRHTLESIEGTTGTDKKR